MIYVVIARETISSLTASVGFTAANIPTTQSRTIYVQCQPLSGDIRVCIDGSTPTTSVGLKMLQNSIFEVWGADALTNFRCIDDGGTASLEVIYMGVS